MKSVVLAAAGAFLAVAATPALADTVTFSQVSQQNTAKPFSYTTAGQTTTFKLAGSPLFNFTTLDFLALVSPIETVTASFSATSNSAAVSISATERTQIFDAGTLSFALSAARAQALTGDASKTNLLTVAFTNGTLYARNGTRSPTFSASTPDASIAYSSDYHDFAANPSALAEFSLSLSSAGTSTGVTYNAQTQRFNGFTASGSGTFAAAIPEPATWGLMIGGFALAGAASRRRSTTAQRVLA
jgi:hypothetical protein